MIAHWCTATHGAFRSFFNAPINAPIAAHVSQTSLKQYTTKGAPEILIEYRINGWVKRRIHISVDKMTETQLHCIYMLKFCIFNNKCSLLNDAQQ